MSNKYEEVILIPIDFSPISEEAVIYASRLSLCMKIPLRLLHVVHDPSDSPSYYHPKEDREMLNNINEVASEMMSDFIAQLNESCDDFKRAKKLSPLVIDGVPVSKILEVIENTRPTMVVMNSHGRTNLAHVILGSKTEQIMRLSPVPVTIVKSKERQHSLYKTLMKMIEAYSEAEL